MSASSTPSSLVWFRQDLRIADNPALSEAARKGPVYAAFIWSPEEETPWQPGGASRWWLHHSLTALASDLSKLNIPLILRRPQKGETTYDVLFQLCRETNARAVYWNRRYEPQVVLRDTKIKEQLSLAGISVQSFNASLLKEPWELKTGGGTPYQVYTPFFKALVSRGLSTTELASPEQQPALPAIRTDDLNAWKLLPSLNWAEDFYKVWQPGEAGANRRLQSFLLTASEYDTLRDRPDSEGTSRLSPHLHFGEISPRQIWNAVLHAIGERKLFSNVRKMSGSEVYLKEIVWREFGYHLLYHFPQTPTQPLRTQFERFPWLNDELNFRAWTKGNTGYPIVDAGMRQLWQTGWMHNRVRMIVASFLVKNLLIPWQRGAQWFWDTLVDADLASNTLGWQWTAGCGADAAPYFRVFNPVLQGEKFDPSGDYVRTFIPELSEVEDRYVHRPWESTHPPKHYPPPVVELQESRDRALEAYDDMRG